MGIVVPDPEVMPEWAKKKGILGTYKDLCKNTVGGTRIQNAVYNRCCQYYGSSTEDNFLLLSTGIKEGNP